MPAAALPLARTMKATKSRMAQAIGDVSKPCWSCRVSIQWNLTSGRRAHIVLVRHPDQQHTRCVLSAIDAQYARVEEEEEEALVVAQADTIGDPRAVVLQNGQVSRRLAYKVLSCMLTSICKRRVSY